MRNPGCLNHSRWLTTANRILKLLAGIKIPSEKLQALVMFIFRVYALMWFAIKPHSSCKDGAGHFHQQVTRSCYLNQEQKNIIDPVLHGNSYFAHPENILMAMKIKSFRKSKYFDAVEYFELINWTDLPITEPSLLKTMMDTELQQFIVIDVTPTIVFPEFFCHLQAVGRLMKEVTEASKAVCGPKSRDRFIRARTASCQLMPRFAGLSMGMRFPRESYGKCSLGWDSTHCISYGNHRTVVEKLLERTELSLSVSETVDE